MTRIIAWFGGWREIVGVIAVGVLVVEFIACWGMFR